MEKRLFFALEAHCPWPEHLTSHSKTRVISEDSRHLTLAFLGNVKFSQFHHIPQPSFIAPVGIFDYPIFLPSRHPRVAAWHIHWLCPIEPLIAYHQKLIQFIINQGFFLNDKRPFLPHVTIARLPFNVDDLKENFYPLPMYAGDLHLYESLGHSKYSSLWQVSILPPFSEIDHTADIAYLIRGHSLSEIYLHAFSALCFSFPKLLSYFQNELDPKSLEEIIMILNQIIAKADGEIGCPFKAVSFHGKLIQKQHLTWEMIIDV